MRHLAKTLTQVITTTTLGLALLAFPATVLADRDKTQSFHSFQQPQGHKQNGRYSDHKADHRTDYRDEHWDNRRDARRDVYKDNYRDNYRDNSDRAKAYKYFEGNNYQKWRSHRDDIRRGYIVWHQPRIYNNRYYYHPEYDRYRAHYLRYHNGHRVVHHHHDDNYLEWVTTMLLLNEILDDDYR